MARAKQAGGDDRAALASDLPTSPDSSNAASDAGPRNSASDPVGVGDSANNDTTIKESAMSDAATSETATIGSASEVAETGAGATSEPTSETKAKRKAAASAPLARGAKTQAVRDALRAMPSHSPKEIADKLTAQGIPVSAGFVSGIKFHMKHDTKAEKAKPGRAAVGRPKKTQPVAASTAAAGATDVAGAGVTVDGLLAAKALIDQLGGLAAAVRAISALAQLMSH